jgi:glycosyltransferase involved in cell wall biosynthesis
VVPSTNIKTLLNPRDCRVFQGMGSVAATLVTKHTPHLVDVAQVYPLCLTRFQHKHPEMVIELFATFKKLGQSVRLIFATAHANGAEDQKRAVWAKELAKAKGLTDDEVVFTHESIPETASEGIDRDTVRAMFGVCNLFAFPSETEAGSLVLMEAAQSGNLLVLNESLPCLGDYIPREMAMWVPWGSIKEPGTPVGLEELAARILTRLFDDMSMLSRRHVLKQSSLEAYAERLAEVIGG